MQSRYEYNLRWMIPHPFPHSLEDAVCFLLSVIFHKQKIFSRNCSTDQY